MDATIRRLADALTTANLIREYEETLNILSNGLAGGPLVDDAACRAALANWTMTDDDWTRLRQELGPLQKHHGRQPDWELRRLVTSQLIWEDLSGSEPLGGPAFRLVGDVQKARDQLRYTSQHFRARVADGRNAGLAPILGTYREAVRRERCPHEFTGPS